MGQEALLDRLRHAIKVNKVAHAYLITGEAGSGKRALARAFTEALFCEIEPESEKQGQMDHLRLIETGNHPDVAIVEPEGARIRIDQIRGLQDKFALRSYAGYWKVGIIAGAETMTAAAANSLLKLLEEPSGKAVIMLLAESQSQLLPTIVSRCQIIALKPVPKKQIAVYLQKEYGVSVDAALVIAGLADGALGRAREIIEGDLFQWREKALAVIAAKRAQGLMALDLARSLDAEPGAIEFTLHVFATWFRDLMLVAKGCDQDLLVHQDYLPELLAGSSDYNVLEYQGAIREIKDTLRAINENANRRLALDALFYQMVDLSSFSKVSEVK